MRPLPPVTHTTPNLIQNQQAAQRPAIPATPTHHEPHASGVPAPKLSREQLAVLRHTFNSSPLRRLRAEPPGPGGGRGLASFKADFAAEATGWADCLRPQELHAMAWHTAVQIVPAHEAPALANELVRSVSSPGMPFEKLMDGSFVPGRIGPVESAVTKIINDLLHWKDQGALPPFLTAQARRLDTLLAGYPWPHATPAQAASAVHVFYEHLLAQALDLGDDGPQLVRDCIDALVRSTLDELGFAGTATVGNPDANLLQQAGYVPQEAPGTAPPLALSRFTTADFRLHAPMFDNARQLVEGLASYNADGLHYFMSDVRAKGDLQLTQEVATAALMGIILNPKLNSLERSQALEVIERDLPAGLPASLNHPSLLDECEATLQAHFQPAIHAAFRRCAGGGDVLVAPKGPPPGAKRTAEHAGLTLSAGQSHAGPVISQQAPADPLPQVGPARTSKVPDPARVAPELLAMDVLRQNPTDLLPPALLASSTALMTGLAGATRPELFGILAHFGLRNADAAREVAVATLMGVGLTPNLHAWRHPDMLDLVRSILPSTLPPSLRDRELLLRCIDGARANGHHEVSEELSKYL
jgi:hypothetical protein